MQEDHEMGAFEDADEDRPVMMYDRENPSIEEGVVFPSTVDCRNAVATYSIKAETEFSIMKSDPTRFTVKCSYDRCKWRLHASSMRRSTLFQIKVNQHQHTCPSVNRSQRLRAAKRRWIADASMPWIRQNPSIGLKEIQMKLLEKYGVDVPYGRCYNGKQMALEKIYDKYSDSFQLLYSFKAEVERISPGSLVEIDRHTVEYQIKGKKFRGQLVAACALDGHNWLFPVAYGVLEVESTESSTWVFSNLKKMVGHLEGLVIHTDACKGLETAVDDVIKKHNYHLNQLKSKPKVKEFLEEHHTKIWARAEFNEMCKVDYVNNNLAESFNSRIRKYKSLHIVDLLDKIRQYIMEKFDLRNRIATDHFIGHYIRPAMMMVLMEKTKGLEMSIVRRSPTEAEVTTTDREKREWRYPIDIEKWSCSCRQWQITAFGEEEHWGADNADDHPTANEPAEAEVEDEEEDEEPYVDVLQQQMPPPKETSHEASTQASVVRSSKARETRNGGGGSTHTTH
ncbi:uncharacterized protein [Aegilops tauschii subsp. strangulata]|uniref:uncharacterized protein n=1 Tax=Aegilops tauschii subsp. strangulata TaxID=200361 RepID=UPI001ABC5B31|nr:uncharacterized protein LOC120964866 [Aegilops tauschii subsp. strangulata]